MPAFTTRQAIGSAVALTLVAAVGLSACGSSSGTSSAATKAPTTTTATTAASTAGASTIPVTLTEYKIQPAAASAPAGHVSFDVTNAGQMKHQFTIIRTNKSAATVLSKQNPDDDIPGARGEIASIAPGASKTLVIKNLKAGHYAIVCALPGHYQAGMYTDFTVK
jgi:uncharacterized cupredoxin-like copper-binding protein